MQLELQSPMAPLGATGTEKDARLLTDTIKRTARKELVMRVAKMVAR